jgi:polyisoprenoid-binding protein YceI
MKRTFSAVAVLVVISACLVVYMLMSMRSTDESRVEVVPPQEPSSQERAASADRIPDGMYAVVAEESSFTWSGKKPLIEGYINTGSIAFREGVVTVSGGEVSGTVALDMNTLTALGTPKKPGQEGMLAEHLKGERWFDVATYPTAEVDIVGMTPGTDGSYEVTANLTLHGSTNEIVFPAQVSVDESGSVLVEAQTEIDRTRWGITAGSGSFFDDLADNMVDDMIAISFMIVATSAAQ